MLDVFRGYGVEIELDDEAFLKITETLSRIGVSSRKDKALYQSCHILHKRGRYAIMHFKEMFALDGKPASITENDIQRRNAIASLLEEWGLVTIINPSAIEGNIAPIHQIKILSYREKHEWELVSKYNIGKKKFEYYD